MENRILAFMMTPGMNFYKSLSAIGFLRKSYALKFLFIAFLGIHIPLIGIVLYVGFLAPAGIPPLTLLLLTLVFTLVAAAVTLFVLNRLLVPVKLAEQSLLSYVTSQKMPELPRNFSDEIGSLLNSIQHTVESLEEANKTKLEMMYTITHDLRSPLAQIVLLSELLKSGGVDTGKFIELVKTSAQNELDFIDNYIAILESEGHKELPEKNTKVRLDELVSRSLKTLETQLQQKGLKLEMELGTGLYVYTTKELLLERVIRNLLSNAIKFSHPGGTIEMNAHSTDVHTIISVKDNGMGFLPDQAEQLFVKFTKYKREGTLGESTKGIGLYLTREIVKRHNGTITATSEGEGTGATFVVALTNEPL